MKAVQFNRPHDLQVIEKPLRRLSENEILVRVEACGICGTDVHIVEGTSRSKPPVVLGHEYLASMCRLANAVGALTALKPGGASAIPTRHDVASLLSRAHRQ